MEEEKHELHKKHHKVHHEHKEIESATPWKIATAVFAILFVAALLNTNIFSGSTQQAQQQQQAGTTNADMKLYADDVVKGDANAPVTIIAYTDPSCPFCAAAAGGSEMVAYMKSRMPTYEAAMPGILKNYVDTGKAKVVFRYFPGHGSGVDAMKIMLCANEEGKFWQLHDVFFNNQALMENGDTAGLKKLAVDNGVNSAKLDSCLASNKYDSKLTTDTQRGQAMGVQGTPGFFVNGIEVSGAVPFSDIKSVIDAALG